MAHTTIVASGRVQSWKRKTIKQHLFSSVWDQLSNRTHHTQTVPHSREEMVPTTVVHKVSDEFNKGTYQTTCLWVGRPQFKPIAGPNKAEGKERKMTTKHKTINYNVQRFPIVLGDESVDGDTNEFYALAERGVDTIKDLYVESTDYDHERALIEGADEWLTSSSYWEDSEYGSDITTPKSDVLHPNMYVACTTSKVTWSETRATALANLVTDTTGLDSGDTFGIDDLDRIHLIATRTINPIGGIGGNNEVKWVLRLSDAQWYQCTTDSSSGKWRDLLKYTEKGFDRMLEGHIGVYKNMLIIVSQRSPIFDIENEVFEYVTSASDERTRSQSTNASTQDGTAEIAVLMGLGAIALAEIQEADYVKKGFDYDFSEGMCGIRKRGTERMDIDTTVAATSGRINESSFLYFNASTNAVV